MGKIILWSALLIGIALLVLSSRKLPFKEWLLVYLLTSYFTIVFGLIVVQEKMLDYPLKFFSEYFNTSLLFDYLWFPIFNIYFYRTTYHSRIFEILLQGLVYTSVLTMIETLLEQYTNLIKYYTWTWMHTFIGVFLLMIFLRFLIMFIYKRDHKQRDTKLYP